MFELLGPDDFTTEAMFALSQPNTCFVYVEGDSDCKIMSLFFNSTKVIVRGFDGVQNNKNAVKEAVRISLEKEGSRKRVIGIIDADFDRVKINSPNFVNIFYTDYHDLDIQIFLSKAFNKFIMFMCYKPHLVDHQIIQDKCIEIASLYGLFKFIIYDLFGDWHLIDSRLGNFESHMDDSFLSNVENCDFGTILKNKIRNQFNQECKQIFTQTQSYHASGVYKMFQKDFANGHDVIKIFAGLVLNNKFNLSSMNLSKELEQIYREKNFNRFTKIIEKELRLSYDKETFSESKLCNDIYQEFPDFLDSTLGILIRSKNN